MLATATADAPLLQRVRQAYAAAQAEPYRACTLCDHGRAGQCLQGGTPVPVPTARSRHGACGPEAVHMRIGGWDLRWRSPMCPGQPVTEEQLRMAFRQISRPGWPSTLEAALEQPAYRVALYGIARNLHRRGLDRAPVSTGQLPLFNPKDPTP